MVETSRDGGLCGRLAALTVMIGVACSSPSGPESCTGVSTALPGAVCVNMDAAGDLTRYRALIEAEVERTLEAIREIVPISDLQISIIADPARVIPEIGIGGFTPSRSEVQIFGDPTLPDVEGILEGELLGILSHEIHHALRRRSVGYGSTLLQAAVSEGLADHFALEVGGGEPPPWSVALTPGELEVWLPEVVARTSGSYDHSEWFFGTTPSIPRWTGYAVGFELVRRYIEEHPGARASGLIGEPASSFIPSAQ